MATYRFERRGRSRTALIATLSIWGLLGGLTWAYALSPWIVGGVVLFTLPAVLEGLWDARAWLSLTDTDLSWQSAGRDVRLPLAMIDTVRLDTRLDFSVRVTLCLADGRRLRLPPACTPPHRQFEAELQARGVTTRRHHFSLGG